MSDKPRDKTIAEVRAQVDKLLSKTERREIEKVEALLKSGTGIVRSAREGFQNWLPILKALVRTHFCQTCGKKFTLDEKASMQSGSFKIYGNVVVVYHRCGHCNYRCAYGGELYGNI